MQSNPKETTQSERKVTICFTVFVNLRHDYCKQENTMADLKSIKYATNINMSGKCSCNIVHCYKNFKK